MTSFGSSAITSLLQKHPRSPFASGKLSSAPFNLYAKILHVGPRYSSNNPRIQNLRSWPVAGFEAIRIYYALEEDAMHIIRILHGKRDVRRILGNE
jgi:hypothetical protein